MQGSVQMGKVIFQEGESRRNKTECEDRGEKKDKNREQEENYGENKYDMREQKRV